MDVDKRLANLEEIVEDLKCNLSNVQNCIDEDRKTVRRLQHALSNLKGPLQKALNCLMPKVEALLQNRGLNSELESSAKDHSTSSNDSLLEMSPSASKDAFETNFFNAESVCVKSVPTNSISVSTHTESEDTQSSPPEVKSRSIEVSATPANTSLAESITTPTKLSDGETVFPQKDFGHTGSASTRPSSPHSKIVESKVISPQTDYTFPETTRTKTVSPVISLTIETLSPPKLPVAPESNVKCINSSRHFTRLFSPIEEVICPEPKDTAEEPDLSQANHTTEECGPQIRASNTRTILPRKGAPNSLSSMVLAASEKGNAEMLLRLLEADADFCERNQQGNTALHLSASGGHERCVIFLLGSGAKVDTTGDRLRTPLHCAAVSGHERVVRRLLMAGATPDVRDADGDTPLMMAARCGYVEIVSTLLEFKASPAEYSRQGDTPLLIAIKAKQWPVTEVLIHEGLALNEVSENNNSAIVCAAKAGKWNIVDLLMQKGALPGKFRGWDNSPLVMAAQQGEVKILRKILALPQKPSEEEMTEALSRIKDFSVLWAFEEEVRGILRGKTGQKGMWRAAKNGLSHSLSLLLHAGVDVNSVNDTGAESALHLSIENGRFECVKELVARGANIHLKNEHGDTALHYASRKGQKEIVCLLLEAGADPMIENNELDTPLHLARTDSIKSFLQNFPSR